MPASLVRSNPICLRILSGVQFAQKLGMDDLELIKQRINIVDLISEYLTLKKAGVNYKANCPFHSERTPSFMVSPERGIWKCFGCNRGGDHFKFLMEKEGLEFKDALEILAQRAGVILKRSRQQDGRLDRLYEANEKARQFYSYLLLEHKLGRKALEYLKGRGLTEETIKQFGIGYAPKSWGSLARFLGRRGFTVSEMVRAGLCVPSRDGCYDRFRGRIIFPIADVRGRVMGFSGRVFPKEGGIEPDPAETGPKYVNTPQTPIYDKGRSLFGLSLAKGFIREKNEAVVVEGDMDMIMSFQSGVKNVVASKGTALTEDQVGLVKKYADTILLCFDADLAGDGATRRGIEVADKAGLNIKVIVLAGAKDPAQACQEDPRGWGKAVAEAVPIYDYYLQSVARRFDVKTAAGKKALLAELLPIWQKISDPIGREHYIQKLATLLQVRDDLVRSYLKKWHSQSTGYAVRPILALAKSGEDSIARNPPLNRRKLLEEYLIALFLHIPQDHTYIPNFPETLFTEEELKQLYVMLVLFLDSISFSGRAFKISEFIKTIPEELVPRVDSFYLREIDEKLEDKNMWQKELDNVVSGLKKMLIKDSLEKLSLQIKSAQEFNKAEQLEALNRRFRDLSVRLKNL